MKDAYWFKHDSNARHDPRVLILRARFGEAGYARYFMLIEIMREAHGYKLKVDDYIYAMVGLDLGIPPDQAKMFMDSCVEIGLFKQDTHIYSESLLRRLDIMTELSQKRAKSAVNRWDSCKPDAKPMQTGMQKPCKTDANTMQTGMQKDSIRLDKIREEERREDMGTPTLQDVEDYCKETGKSISPKDFFSYYEAAGWVMGSTPIRNWRALADKWQSKDEAARPLPPKVWEASRSEIEGLVEKNFRAEHVTDGRCSFCGTKAHPVIGCDCHKYISGLKKAHEKSRVN